MEKFIASFSGGKDSTAMVLRLIEEKRPLGEVVFFDTGWEFPQIYEHIARFERYTGLTVTRLHPRRSFTYWMLERPIVANKGPNKGQVHRIGNGWPSPTRRWCTREKVGVIDKHCKGAIRYIGIASDEAHRMTSANLMSGFARRFPLYEWDMNEADALAYCKARGFDWGGLYDHFPRVSCFCCPLQRIGQLRTLRHEYPDLWAQMLEWDTKMGEYNRGFRGYDKVCDLERRFSFEDLQLKLL
jgi:3'-phosphoadenosine 5'-phosphosulfate sulfotransferase (PAPS reductase)/FAD synthetase